MPWPGIEPKTLRCMGRCSTRWAILVRAIFFIFISSKIQLFIFGLPNIKFHYFVHILFCQYSFQNKMFRILHKHSLGLALTAWVLAIRRPGLQRRVSYVSQQHKPSHIKWIKLESNGRLLSTGHCCLSFFSLMIYS